VANCLPIQNRLGRQPRRTGPVMQPAAAGRPSASRASSDEIKRRVARDRPANRRLRRTAGEGGPLKGGCPGRGCSQVPVTVASCKGENGIHAV